MTSLLARMSALAATHAMKAVYQSLLDTGSSHGLAQPVMAFSELTKLMGFEAVWEFDKRHAQDAQ